jgi:hypothetical protein
MFINSRTFNPGLNAFSHNPRKGGLNAAELISAAREKMYSEIFEKSSSGGNREFELIRITEHVTRFPARGGSYYTAHPGGVAIRYQIPLKVASQQGWCASAELFTAVKEGEEADVFREYINSFVLLREDDQDFDDALKGIVAAAATLGIKDSTSMPPVEVKDEHKYFHPDGSKADFTWILTYEPKFSPFNNKWGWEKILTSKFNGRVIRGCHFAWTQSDSIEELKAGPAPTF